VCSIIGVPSISRFPLMISDNVFVATVYINEVALAFKQATMVLATVGMIAMVTAF
jgi:Na+/H+ antiporter NhaB